MTGKTPQAHVVLAGMGAAASSGLLGRCANGLGKHQILASIFKGGHVLAVEGLAQPAGGVCKPKRRLRSLRAYDVVRLKCRPG